MHSFIINLISPTYTHSLIQSLSHTHTLTQMHTRTHMIASGTHKRNNKSVESEMHAANYGICRKMQVHFLLSYTFNAYVLSAYMHFIFAIFPFFGFRRREKLLVHMMCVSVRSLSHFICLPLENWRKKWQISNRFWICFCHFPTFICHVKGCSRQKIMSENKNWCSRC